MPTIQALKKQLRGIRSTQKIAKAMKTASTVKFSKLNAIHNEYSKYSDEYRALYSEYSAEYNSCFEPTNSDAPVCLIVIAANKGMCGSFNSQMLKFADEINEKAEKPYFIIPCGKKAISHYEQIGVQIEKTFVFSDVPKYSEACELFGYITALQKEGRISSVKVAFPKYLNMMTQTPALCDMFATDTKKSEGSENIPPLYFPDKDAVIFGTAHKMMSAFIFDKILESALGAQAATLMTMRSAYDTASEYTVRLEAEINRKRQSQVTADVIETSAEHSQEN
jgi:F-type H+-transporting ATPase subunit gamma